MTAAELVTQTLRLIGVLATGETAATSEVDDGYAALNEVIDGWGAGPEGLYKNTRQTISSPATTFTLSGGNRPQRVLGANYTISAGVQQLVKVVGGEEFSSSVFERTSAIFPKVLHCDYAYPTATLTLAPTFQAGGTLELFTVVPAISQFSSQSDVLAFPAGYARALKYALAVHLAPEYGRPVTAEVAAIAEQSRKALIDLNVANYAVPPVPAAA